MKRRVLLITNPGKKGDDNYCGGVYKDQENYFSYFKEPIGGYWANSELRYFDKPSKYTVTNEIKLLAQDEIEFSIIIFCGHGWYSSKSSSNIIDLNEKEQMDALDLRADANKRIIILDSCRKVYPVSINEDLIKAQEIRMLSDKAQAKLNPEQCKKYYNQVIDECPKQLIVTYGCNITEVAGDNPAFGGYYSSSLLAESRGWAANQLTTIDLAKKYATERVPSCHNDSVPRVVKLSGGTQHPQIEKPRVSLSTDYLPFIVVA
jgi:hypothetical protein